MSLLLVSCRDYQRASISLLSKTEYVIQGICRGSPMTVGAVCGKDTHWNRDLAGSRRGELQLVDSHGVDVLRVAQLRPASAGFHPGLRRSPRGCEPDVRRLPLPRHPGRSPSLSRPAPSPSDRVDSFIDSVID